MADEKTILKDGKIITERALDDAELLAVNEATVNFYYGKMRSGKTYTATHDAIQDLKNGNVVFTSWRIKWDGVDERKSKWNLWKAKWGLKKEFKVFPKENYHYLPYDGLEMLPNGKPDISFYKPYTCFIDKFLSITDAIIYLDEGQKPLNSYEKTKINEAKQDAIIFTGHMNRTINIIAQRPIQIHPILRVNVNRYYKITKETGWLGGTTFKRTEYQDTDSAGLPDESKEPDSEEEYGFDKEIGEAYNSKYMRGNLQASQENLSRIMYLSRKDIQEMKQ